jgi:hypothetical protein
MERYVIIIMIKRETVEIKLSPTGVISECSARPRNTKNVVYSCRTVTVYNNIIFR